MCARTGFLDCISVVGSTLGATRRGSVRSPAQPSDPSLLLPPIGFGSASWLGCVPTRLASSPEPLRQPSFFSDSPSLATHPGTEDPSHDAGGTGLGRGLASGPAGVGNRPPGHTAGLSGGAVDAAGASDAVVSLSSTLDNECLETLRTFLVDMQGLLPAAADVIVRRHWAPGSRSGLCSVWKQWLRHCDSVDGVSFSAPSIGEFINFLQKVSEGAYRTGAKHGVATSSGWVRSVRSGISSLISLMTSAPRMGENPLVTAFISSLIKQDLLDHGKQGVRYGDTWDATLVFDYWMQQPDTDALSYS